MHLRSPQLHSYTGQALASAGQQQQQRQLNCITAGQDMPAHR